MLTRSRDRIGRFVLRHRGARSREFTLRNPDNDDTIVVRAFGLLHTYLHAHIDGRWCALESDRSAKRIRRLLHTGGLQNALLWYSRGQSGFVHIFHARGGDITAHAAFVCTPF